MHMQVYIEDSSCANNIDILGCKVTTRYQASEDCYNWMDLRQIYCNVTN